MGTITINNLSVLSDHAAVARVALYMLSNSYESTHDKQGAWIVDIKKERNKYTVTDHSVCM